MGWTRKPRRSARHHHRRPSLESLEIRTLLSTGLDRLGLQPAEGPGGSSSTNYDTILGASSARSKLGIDGAGLAVAVIDAGVNYDNKALGDGYGTGHKVVGGWDFAGNDDNPISSGMQHGTAVAGLIASASPDAPGIAPGADIVALRVFDDANKGDFNRVADALQWVVDHHQEYNISVVNLSISDGRNYARNWYANDGGPGQRITQLIDTLSDLHIPVVTATGNSFDGTQGAGFTGIVPTTISVTATDASDRVMANAQRLGAETGGASATDIAAPGEGLMAPSDGDTVSSVSGTSFSAALVSGTVVLLQQLYQSRFQRLPTVEMIDEWLGQGAATIDDSVTGIQLPRLDVAGALAQVPTPALQILDPPVAPPAPAPPPEASAPSPPVPVSTPTPTPTPEPAPTPTPAPETSDLTLNGQAIDTANPSAPNGIASLPAALQKVIRSLRDWWGTPGFRIRVWAAAQGLTEGVIPAGLLKRLVSAVSDTGASSTSSNTSDRPARTTPSADATSGRTDPAGTTDATPRRSGMHRSWHGRAFVGARRARYDRQVE